VTSSKSLPRTRSGGGISAMELQRQMGFGSYGTAWSWLHKIRRAMVRPQRAPLGERVEADETYVGGPRSGRPGRGAGGKALVAGAVESRRGKARGRRLGRLRLAIVPDASANSLAGCGKRFVVGVAAGVWAVESSLGERFSGVSAAGVRGVIGPRADSGRDHAPSSFGSRIRL